jgi:hypothetical protein
MPLEEAKDTLRDTLAATFDKVIPEAAETLPATPVDAPAAAATTAEAETPAQAEQRARDEKGRFQPKDSASAPATATKPADATAAAPAAVAETPKPIQRPSSWKKEMWPIWDKLATGVPLNAQESRQAAEYNLQRETEAARGVSTYKAEYDRAKPLLSAFEPHRADFEKWGIDPGAQFSKYVEIHKGLALGSEQDKLGTILRLAQDYKIPLEKMFVQQNGQLFFNPQVRPTALQPQAQPQQSIEQTVHAVIQRERSTAEIAAMSQDTQKYPHFETLRETMAQLLDANLANDLLGAYEAALNLPQHRDLLAQAQEQQRVSEEAAKKAQAAAAVQRARAAAVSPRSATPAGATANAQKGLRASLLDAVEQHTG